jgi:hypothetical protein
MTIADNPALHRHLDDLAAAGARFLDPATGRDKATPIPSGTGAQVVDHFDPRLLAAQIDALTEPTAQSGPTS